MTIAASSFGQHLREWRHRRRMSQLDLALAADV
jgi:transcriptional regulator with XRE-family HTH domain